MRLRTCCVLVSLAGFGLAQTPVRRALNLDDMARIKGVADPHCSPDGQWVAYVVRTTDVKADRSHSHIWMANLQTGENLQMTDSTGAESSPRWSPDGKYLSFTSSRPGPAKGNQVWLLSRQGGEAVQLTDVKGSLESYAWSPDSRRLALVVQDPAPETKPDEPPQPIVVDRYHFRQDNIGFLPDRHTYIWIYDLGTKKLTRLTSGHFDESGPVWSPDGARIAFFSNHDRQPQREDHGQLYVVDVRPGAVERALTKTTDYAEGRAAWSPDGKMIAFTQGDPNAISAYSQAGLATVMVDGSDAPTILTSDFDRRVADPMFEPDGKSVDVLVTDDRSEYPAAVALADHSVNKLLPAPVVVSALTHAASCTAGLMSSPDRPTEVWGHGPDHHLHQLSHQNDALFAELKLGKVVGVDSTSSDGTKVGGILTYPVDYVAGSKVPLLLRIHGGPNSQDQFAFNLENQMFAAHGYAVLNVNYRGSAGRGRDFAKAIAADWGHDEVIDLEGAVDHVIQMGVADPNRLGVGGWSYGGILTDYLIATNTRFKAATDGAGTGFTVSFYGVDQYINQYNYEIGPPWEPKAWATYEKISYPFLHADRIKTPTIYFGGTLDANVPLVGGEQMYQALKTLGVPTELIVYPGQYHGISRPSFVRDRMQRYIAWYDKYLKSATGN